MKRKEKYYSVSIAIFDGLAHTNPFFHYFSSCYRLWRCGGPWPPPGGATAFDNDAEDAAVDIETLVFSVQSQFFLVVILSPRAKVEEAVSVTVGVAVGYHDYRCFLAFKSRRVRVGVGVRIAAPVLHSGGGGFAFFAFSACVLPARAPPRTAWGRRWDRGDVAQANPRAVKWLLADLYLHGVMAAAGESARVCEEPWGAAERLSLRHDGVAGPGVGEEQGDLKVVCKNKHSNHNIPVRFRTSGGGGRGVNLQQPHPSRP